MICNDTHEEQCGDSQDKQSRSLAWGSSLRWSAISMPVPFFTISANVCGVSALCQVPWVVKIYWGQMDKDPAAMEVSSYWGHRAEKPTKCTNI